MARDSGKLVFEIVVFIAVTLIFVVIEMATGENDDDEMDVAPAAEYQIPPNTLCVETRPNGVKSLARCKAGSGSEPAVPQP